MSEQEISERKRAILDFIIRYTSEHKRPPAMRDIASAVGLASHSGIAWHVEDLIRLGYVKRIDDGTARNLRAIKTPEGDPL